MLYLLSYTAQKVFLGISWFYPVRLLHHYIFVISQLWLIFHPRSTVVLLDKETPGTSREIYSEDEEGEDRTRNPWITNTVLLPLSYRAQKLLLGRSWVYPVDVLNYYIFLISQLWLTSHQWSTVVLLYTETACTSRQIYSEDAEGEDRTRNTWITNPVVEPLSYTAQKLLLGRSWVYPVGVLYHYIFLISKLLLTSHSRSTVVLLDTDIPGTNRKILSEDAEADDRTRNFWITNPVL